MTHPRRPVGRPPILLPRRSILKLAGLSGLAAMGGPSILAACIPAGPASPSAPTASAGASAIPSAAAVADIEKLVWAVASDPANVDNVISGVNNIIGPIVLPSLEGLAFLADDYTFEPGLATSWERPDDSTYVFKIRQGVKFWDGTDLTIDDVLFSMQRHASDKAVFPIRNVESIVADGDDTLIMTFTGPYAMLLSELSVQGYPIIQKAHAEAMGERLGASGDPEALPIGTGPYRWTEFVDDSGLKYERWDGYWGVRSPAKKLEIRTIPESASRLIALQSGDVQGTFSLPTDVSLKDWQNDASLDIQAGPGVDIVWLSLPQDTLPFSDPHIRRAVAHATDRQTIVDVVLGGGATVAASLQAASSYYTLVPQQEADATLNEMLNLYPFDLAKTKAEIDQADAATPRTGKLRFATWNPAFLKIATAMQQNLREAGFELEISQEPDDSYYAEVWKDWPDKPPQSGGAMHIDLWNGTYPDARDNAYLLMIPELNNQLSTGYANQEVIEAMRAQNMMVDNAERGMVLLDAMKQFITDLAYFPLYHPIVGVAVRKEFAFEGLTPWVRGVPWTHRIQADG